METKTNSDLANARFPALCTSCMEPAERFPALCTGCMSPAARFPALASGVMFLRQSLICSLRYLGLVLVPANKIIKTPSECEIEQLSDPNVSCVHVAFRLPNISLRCKRSKHL